MRVVATDSLDGPSVKLVGVRSDALHGSRAAEGRAAGRRAPSGSNRGKVFNDIGLAAFFSNTATLLNSGVPLIKSLEALATDKTFAKAGPMLEGLIHDIRSGASFSAALARAQDCFSPLIVNLVRAGETGGTLVPTLERIADSIEKRRETKAQLGQALTYPTIVTVLGTGAVGFLMAFVVPVFEETYAKADMPLPAITLALIAVSGIVAKTWWIGLLVMVSLTLGYRQFRHHPRLRSLQDRLLIRLPVLGPVVRSIMVGRFVQAFGSLLNAGLSIKDSLALTERVVRHSEFVEMVRELRMSVARGEGIGRKLEAYPFLFPPLLTRMICLGERSGQLAKMAGKMAQFVEKDLSRRTQQMKMLVEPVITVVMAFVIGTIALAIYLPIFDMFKQVG